MSRLASWPVLLGLFALAMALGLAAGGDTQVSTVPSLTNTGPRGLKVLSTFLTESGFDVRRGVEPLQTMPADVATVVITAPEKSTVDTDDIAALEAVLARGGTVVLLVSRRASMSQWAPLASIRGGGPLTIESLPLDGSGANVSVEFPVGPLAGLKSLRLSSEVVLRVMDDGAVALTEPPAIWAMPRKTGELYLAAGADLAENARFDLADNARFWTNLAARGPVWFDESLHSIRAGPRPSLNVLATALQCLVVALAFVGARGARLGPPRAEPPASLRSSTEYVDAMATLTERAGVEGDLVKALRKQLRATLHERLGIALTLPNDEAARLVATALSIDDAEARGLFDDTDFLSLSRRLARLDALL